MEESVVGEMGDGGFRLVQPLSVQFALGCEGQEALVRDDESGLRLGVELPVCEPPKDEVTVSPAASDASAPTEIGVIPGETVERKSDNPPDCQTPNNEVNGASTSVSPPTSSVPLAPVAIGVIQGEVLKRKRGRPSKLFKRNVNGAMPLEVVPPSTIAPEANGTEKPSGETMKRKMGRPWNKGINGAMPFLSSCYAQASNGEDMLSGGRPKRKRGRPLKMRDNGVIPIVSSPSAISAPLGTEMRSAGPMKKKRGRPWKREINGAKPVVSSPSTGLPSTATELVKRKRGRPWKRRSIGAMPRELSPAKSPAPIAMGLLSSSATQATISTEMPSGEPVKRKAGRPRKNGIGGSVYLKPCPTSSRALGSRTETSQQSTSHATPERCIEQLLGDGRRQEMAQVEPSSSDGMGAHPQTRLLENVSDVDLCQSLPEVAIARETLMRKALPLHFQDADLGSLGIGTTVGTVGSSEVCATVPSASHVTDQLESTVGVIPIPSEYEHLYKEIEDRHGRLDNGQSVGQNDTLPYATLVELLSVVQQLKNLAMESVTEGMIASFERTVTIGRLFNFNVGWLHENLNRLRGDYEKRCAIDVVGLEQDVQRCDTWLEATQDELRQMEAAYVAAKKKVDDLIKSRNDANAKLVAAREHLKSSEKFPFVI